jgi:hypothetical protein
MIECIFTLDYEIYGDGTGSLRELVYEPTERLCDTFGEWNARFVAFVEVAEFEKIEQLGTDAAISLVKTQIRELHRDGYEVALHLHPQWYNGHYENGRWHLDPGEYNLCTLPRPRISQIVDKSLSYLRYVLDEPQFVPLSFRAGNWLFQPSKAAAELLGERGVKVDSSVFKGGVQRNHGLDYRPANRNGYCWRFSSDVNQVSAAGSWIEVPIHTEMVPAWKMATSKRMNFVNGTGVSVHHTRYKVNRALDLMRVRYPMKFDFCRMTLSELTRMVDRVTREDEKTPDCYRPLVAIGHTKDLNDFRTIHEFLAFLHSRKIAISTFRNAWPALSRAAGTVPSTSVHASVSE